MEFSWLLKFVLITYTIPSKTEQQKCPCFCDTQNRMNCANQNWDQVPSNIPNTTTVINLQVNKITQVKANAFAGLNKVVLLRIDDNLISKIEAKAFYGMTNLNELVLTKNDISVLKESMVDPKAPLARGIKLQDNKLKTFPLNLLKRHKIPINVDNNKIHCDCFSVIPKDLAHLVLGGACHSPDFVNKTNIVHLTYDTVKCGVCTGKQCNFGSCYEDNGQAKCLCFHGYSGDSCNVNDAGVGDVVTTTTTTTTTQTTVTTIAATNTTDGKTTKRRQTPQDSSPIPFQILEDIKISTIGTKTGSKLVIQGCTIRMVSLIEVLRQTRTYFIQDGVKKIQAGNKQGNSSFERIMDPLVIDVSNASSQGLYKCAIESDDVLDDFYSKPVYVQYQDVSETRVKMKVKDTRQNDTKAELDEIESNMRKYIAELNLDKVAVVQKPRKSLIRETNFWKFKILIENVTQSERLQYCLSFMNLEERLSKKIGDKVTTMDCCASYGKSSNSMKDALTKDLDQAAIVGDSIKIRCKKKKRLFNERKCEQRNILGPRWVNENATNKCLIEKKDNAFLKQLKNTKTCDDNSKPTDDCIQLEKKISKLARLVKKDDKVIKTTNDVDNTAEILIEIKKKMEKLQETSETKKKVASDALLVVDEVMTVDTTLIARSQIKRNSSTKFVHTLEAVSEVVGDTLTENNSTFSLSLGNVAMSVSLINYTSADDYTSVVALTKPNAEGKVLEIVSGIAAFSGDVTSIVTLSNADLAKFQKPVVRGLKYESNAFFMNDQQLAEAAQGVKLTKNVPGSNILAASLGDQAFTSLASPVTVAFRNVSQGVRTGNIKFWDFEEEGWSTRGCWKINSSQPDIITWNCSHLTNFALIIDVNQDVNNPEILQIITFIGCGISIGALLVTLIVYISIEKIRRRLAPRILISLSSSLLLLLVVFLALVDKTKWVLGCQVIAGVLQYLILSTFAWMFCEAINLYRSFVTLFKRSTSEKTLFLRMSVFSWGVPLLIVLLTVFLQPENLGSDKICVVNGIAFYFGILLPVGLILISNWIVLFLSMRGMRTSKLLLESASRPITWLEIWRAFVCATILGLTWTFGLLAIGEARDLFQWLFCILNSLQGLFIFLLFVLNNKEIKKKMKKVFESGSTGAPTISTTSGVCKNEYPMKKSY